MVEFSIKNESLFEVMQIKYEVKRLDIITNSFPFGEQGTIILKPQESTKFNCLRALGI